ncbi:MAG: SET domain-containing protein-lysine N-methyltransferase [Alphaproteobacteria bacterium]|nr:SET domain-containing protein-lysine N-methyltransferase [Alphaproteobacteria bacterium]
MHLTYFSPKTEKRDSVIAGRGLFATALITVGETVVVKGGYVMTKGARDAVGETLGPSEIQIANDLFIGPTTAAEREGAMMHLNHSCAPNLGVNGQIAFVAMRDIQAGEELTFDYAMTDDEDGLEMTCQCGATDCRETVTGKDWQQPALQRKYRGYFSFYLARKIEMPE